MIHHNYTTTNNGTNTMNGIKPSKTNHKHNHYYGKLANLRSVRFHNLHLSVRDSMENNQNIMQTYTGQSEQQQHIQPPTRILNRRRSTINSIGMVNPLQEIEDSISSQKLLQLNQSSLLTTFISIHSNIHNKLLYISEIISNDMNPQFEINLPYVPPNIHKCVIKLWCRNHGDGDWKLLCLYKLNLRKVTTVESSSLENLDLYKSNTLSLQLNDGWFTFQDMLNRIIIDDDKKLNVNSLSQPIPSYTFDSIRCLNNLYNSLQELFISKHNLMQQIKLYIGNLQDYKNINNINVVLNKLQFQVHKLIHDVNRLNSQNEQLNNKIYNIKQKINDLHNIIETFNINTKEIIENKLELYETEIQNIQVSQLSLQQQKLNKLLKTKMKLIEVVFPIDNIDSTKFSILGFQFPQDQQEILAICYYNNPSIELKNQYYQPEFDNETQLHNFKIQQINATLSIVVQLMILIADITNTDYKYKMVLHGSQSYIIDEISKNYPLLKKTPSHNIKPFKFPLYYDSTTNEKVIVSLGNQSSLMIMNQEFEYGLKLLNKNLIILIDKVQNLMFGDGSGNYDSHVPIECLDNVLWNLKYLELFMTV